MSARADSWVNRYVRERGREKVRRFCSEDKFQSRRFGSSVGVVWVIQHKGESVCLVSSRPKAM